MSPNFYGQTDQDFDQAQVGVKHAKNGKGNVEVFKESMQF